MSKYISGESWPATSKSHIGHALILGPRALPAAAALELLALPMPMVLLWCYDATLCRALLGMEALAV